MAKSPDSNQEGWKNIIDEIEKALLEIDLSEKAFQWAQNDPEEVDLAITRKQAAVEYFNFLTKKAKKMGVKLDKNQLVTKVLK
jgi:hypothetical protein